MKPYTPRGQIVPFIQAVKADPERVWTVSEAAQTMNGMRLNKVAGSLIYALRNQILFRKKVGRSVVFRGVPFEGEGIDIPQVREKLERRIKTDGAWITTEDDIRVPKVVPGWKPPQMVCARFQ